MDSSTEKQYIREIIFGQRRKVRFWEIMTDKGATPEETIWYMMTKIEGVNLKEVSNIYGERTWIEYGLKQSKNELGWPDYRLTDYSSIEKWWEIVMSVYLMVSLQMEIFQEHGREVNRSSEW